MTLMDQYLPFASGPGALTMMAGWRRMARLWCSSGVVRGVGQELVQRNPGWVEPGIFALYSGAVWVNGFYAEHNAPEIWLTTPGDDGLIVAELDLERPPGQIQFVYRQGLHEVHQDPNGFWQTPLWDLRGYGNAVDRREFVPPPPPLATEDLPAWVPRGLLTVANQQGELLLNPGENVLVNYVYEHSRFAPGRHFRFTAYVEQAQYAPSTTEPQMCAVDFYVRDDWSGERVRVRVLERRGQGQNESLGTGTVQVTVANCGPGLVGVLQLSPSSAQQVRFPANGTRIEVEDMGA